MADVASAHPKDRKRASALVARTLEERWRGTRITTVGDVAGDASARRYLRFGLAEADERPLAGAAPRSLVVMLCEGSGAALSSDELAVFGDEGPKELPFVNVWRFLSPLTDAVPEIFAVSEDQSVLVLEDVGDVSLWQAANEPGADPEALFGRALDLLADLQTRAVDDGSGCYAFGQAFDERLFDWEFEHFIEHGLARSDACALAACRAELHAVAVRLDRMPKVFAHRDYHAWNLHVQTRGREARIRVLDFQDALLAPAMYDVASLLTDRSTPELIHSALAHRLVERFAARIPRERLGAEDTRDAFELCALQRVLKVVGRFNYLAAVKGKPRYLDMLPAVVATARRLASGRAGLETTAALLANDVKGGPSCAR